MSNATKIIMEFFGVREPNVLKFSMTLVRHCEQTTIVFKPIVSPLIIASLLVIQQTKCLDKEDPPQLKELKPDPHTLLVLHTKLLQPQHVLSNKLNKDQGYLVKWLQLPQVLPSDPLSDTP